MSISLKDAIKSSYGNKKAKQAFSDNKDSMHQLLKELKLALIAK